MGIKALQTPPYEVPNSALVVRTLTAEDIKPLAAALLDPDCYYSVCLGINSVAEIEKFLASMLSAHEKLQVHPFVIIDGGVHAGVTSVRTILDFDNSAEIGSTWIAPAARRRGLNFRSKIVLLKYCFEQLSRRVVRVRCTATNAHSRSSLEAMGANLDGIIRQSFTSRDGKVDDICIYSFLSHEMPTVISKVESKLSIVPTKGIAMGEPKLVTEVPGFEKIKALSFDIEKLRHHLNNKVIPTYKPIMQGSHFGGWSVSSANGHFDDGWEQGHTAYETVNGKQVWNQEKANAIGVRPQNEYRFPTEICFGYLGIVMTKITEAGFSPRRARISIVKPGGGTSWHRDAEDHEYAIRLHIPLITNDQCHFSTRSEKYFMPADGSAYVVRVNCEHQAVNFGSEDRYHIIMQVWDRRGLTNHNKFDPKTQISSASPLV